MQVASQHNPQKKRKQMEKKALCKTCGNIGHHCEAKAKPVVWQDDKVARFNGAVVYDGPKLKEFPFQHNVIVLIKTIIANR